LVIGGALGNLGACLAAGRLETLSPSALFSYVAWFAAISGVIALVVSPVMKRLSAGAE
jgi:hypothetical protein